MNGLNWISKHFCYELKNIRTGNENPFQLEIKFKLNGNQNANKRNWKKYIFDRELKGQSHWKSNENLSYSSQEMRKNPVMKIKKQNCTEI